VGVKRRRPVREMDFPSALAISTVIGVPAGVVGMVCWPDLSDSEQVHIREKEFLRDGTCVAEEGVSSLV
jgi:hypothetical protein